MPEAVAQGSILETRFSPGAGPRGQARYPASCVSGAPVGGQRLSNVAARHGADPLASATASQHRKRPTGQECRNGDTAEAAGGQTSFLRADEGVNSGAGRPRRVEGDSWCCRPRVLGHHARAGRFQGRRLCSRHPLVLMRGSRRGRLRRSCCASALARRHQAVPVAMMGALHRAASCLLARRCVEPCPTGRRWRG
jgi:hypothetical protein